MSYPHPRTWNISKTVACLSLASLSLVMCLAAPIKTDRIDAMVRNQMAVSQIPGAAVVVIDHGRIAKLATYGLANLEWRQPVTPDTRFQLASATKIFTGILLMRLVEQGSVDLDAPLTHWFPEAPPAWAGIHVRQLANHTSGLPEDLGSPAPRTVEAIVAAAQARPLAYPPGTEARYGFTDFTVLRAILEKASGKTLPDLLKQEITNPLKMISTGFALATDDGTVRSAEILPRRASLYGLRDGHLVTSDFFFAPEGYGAGGLYSSASNLALLFQALDTGKLLKPSSLAELETPAELPNGKSGFGVGWTARIYRGATVVGHSGGPALADILRVESRKLTIVVLTNQQVFFPLLAEDVADQFLPNPDPPATIHDARPKLTANLKAVFSESLNGTPTPARFAPGKAEATFAPLKSPFGHALLVGVGPLQTAHLLSETPMERRYQLVFQQKSMIWVVGFDPDDRLTALHPE